MRRIVAAGCALALGVVLAGCSGGESEPQEVDESPDVSAPVESPVETPDAAPEPTPEPQTPEPGEPTDPAQDDQLPADADSLESTFSAMLDALEQDGEEGLTPFLADPQAGDLWRLSDWEWTGGPCVEGGPGESACVGYFEKDGVEMENIFGFENIDGEWRLFESWVAWE